jgi:hypothetical protein
MQKATEKPDFKEFFYYDCDAIQDDKIQAVYSLYGRAGRDLILNQIIPKLSKLECFELGLNDLTFISFSDPEIRPAKVQEIIEDCIYKIGLFNTDKISFWNIRALEHKLNRFKVGQINSDNKLKKQPERLGEKYKAEISKINEILARPLYDIRYTTVKRPFEKINNFDTTV